MAIAFLKNENTAWKILSTIDNQMVVKAFPMVLSNYSFVKAL